MATNPDEGRDDVDSLFRLGSKKKQIQNDELKVTTESIPRPVSIPDKGEQIQLTHNHMNYKMDYPQRGTALIINNGEFLAVTEQKRRSIPAITRRGISKRQEIMNCLSIIRKDRTIVLPQLPRGRHLQGLECMIVGSTTRGGYELDGEAMKKTFAKLGFNIRYEKNKKLKELNEILNEVSMESHADADCFVCVIMTHGNNKDLVYTTDGTTDLSRIVGMFNGEGCPQLVGKPKLFFIQACRGQELDHGVGVFDEIETDVKQGTKKIPVEADILLSQATTPGYFAWRGETTGSYYIKYLAEQLQEYGQTEDLLSVLTRVNSRVAFDFESRTHDYKDGSKQVPSFTSQLTKRLVFSPKGTN